MVETFELNYFSLNKQTPLSLRPTLPFKYPVAGKPQGLQREPGDKNSKYDSVITFNSS